MHFPSITLTLPIWVDSFVINYGRVFPDDLSRMGFVTKLAEQNVLQKSGGPFAAAIFCNKTNSLIAPGVNVVVSSCCSLAHAEMMAIGIAQQKTASFDLGPDSELFTSTAPCAMCLGAIPWSGVRRVVCAARDEDARAIGFDEGAKISNWTDALRERGIDVRTDFMRFEGKAVLDLYSSEGGKIYNGRNENNNL